MTVTIITFLMMAAILFLLLSTLLQLWLRFPKRTVDDLIPFLLPVSLEEINRLFDPRQEALLRCSTCDQEFRAMQRRRLHLADECLRRMAHNAAVLGEWANSELDRSHPLTQPLAADLHQHALKVRVYALMTRLKVDFWIVLRLERTRWLPVPHLGDFRECLGIQGVESYENLKTAAASLFAQFGPADSERFMSNL
jgi:hypothetical protein